MSMDTSHDKNYIMWTVYWPSWNADGQSIFLALVYLKAWVYFFFHAPTSSWMSLTHTKCQQVNLFGLNIHFVSAVLRSLSIQTQKLGCTHSADTSELCYADHYETQMEEYFGLINNNYWKDLILSQMQTLTLLYYFWDSGLKLLPLKNLNIQ